jgi:ATP-dependent Zn protease
MASRLRRRNLIYFILLAGLLALIYASYRSYSSTAAPTEKPLSDLLTALDDKQVAHGMFNSDQDRVDWTDMHAGAYRTFYPIGYEATLVDKFHEAQVPFGADQPTGSNLWLSVILPNVILFVVIGGFLWYVLRRYQGKRPPAG